MGIVNTRKSSGKEAARSAWAPKNNANAPIQNKTIKNERRKD